MKTINFYSEFDSFPWSRQIPESFEHLQGFKFCFNSKMNCDYLVVFDSIKIGNLLDRYPLEKRILICPEPKEIRTYGSSYTNKFGYVLSSYGYDASILSHICHPCLPWHIGAFTENPLSFNYFKSNSFQKTKDISVISSGKTITNLQKLRLEFFYDLSKIYPDKIDFFGRDSYPFKDKYIPLMDYKYHIVLENTEDDNYWTEKLEDAFLAECFPIYSGCRNLEIFFPKESFERINLINKIESFKKIGEIIHSNLYEDRRKSILLSKQLVLEKYNLFIFITNFIKNETEKTSTLSQNLIFQKQPKRRLPMFLFLKNKISKTLGLVKKAVLKPKVKYILIGIYNFFQKVTSKQKRAYSKWLIDKGDKLLLRDNLNLSEKSLVLDIGGFKGDWAIDIHKKYDSNILIFEAVPTYIDFLNLRFSGIKKINIFPYGLSNKDEELFFDVTGDSSRPSQDATGDQKVILKNVNHLFDDGIKGLERVDLAKINIEGGEYPLLEALLESGKIRKIDKLLVQFHKFPSNYRKRYDKIVEELKLTHKMVWCYHMIWECWVKKELSSSPQ